jgi:DNA-binding response OmpR family regulator
MLDTSSIHPSRDIAPLILLIDDVPEDLRWLTALLREDHRTTLATTGHQGLQKAQALRPRLILLDVKLPDMDGLSVCRLLKADPLTATTPVLFLSACNQPHERVSGLDAGAVDFIGKPFYPEEVLARVRVHIALSGSRSERTVGPFDPEIPPPTDLGRNPDSVLVREAMRYIGAHLAELSPVPELARRLGMHEKRLLTLFRDHLGMTVSGFISEERLRQGARLLVETSMSIQDIALTVGFSNPGNFATAFRSRHGQSPLAYRTAVRNEQTPTRVA